MLVRYQPLRQLNDSRGVFGLHGSDFGLAVGTFVTLSLIFDDTQWAILSVPGAILSLVALAPLRLATRRKILRDTFSYFATGRVLLVGRRSLH